MLGFVPAALSFDKSIAPERLEGSGSEDYHSAVDYEHAPYISLYFLERIEQRAETLGVSEVARSPRGFLAAYKLASGEWSAMGRDYFSGQMWPDLRRNFIKRHMTQAKRRREALWKRGEPTRRHLMLMMWAYTPTPDQTTRWIRDL